MPLFARRRLQAMLNEIAPLIDDQKAQDLLARLEKNRVDQALPAEAELALLWAFSKLGDLDIEPDWWGDEKRPDAYTEHLVVGEPAIVEIAAPSDNSISGEEAMDGIAVRISDFASRFEKGLGDYLYFRFGTESGHVRGIYHRKILAPVGYEISEKIRSQIELWVRSKPAYGSKLLVSEPGLSVEIERKAHRQTRYHNIFSNVLPEAQSIDNNPLAKLLVRKITQLKAARIGTHRFIFLSDAGSTLLKQLNGTGGHYTTGRRVTGEKILSNFVEKHAHSVDSVVVMAPFRDHAVQGRGKLRWKVSVFNRPGFDFDLAPLKALVEHLPKPRFDGHQARSLFRQGAYKPTARAWSLGTNFRGHVGGPMEVRISSRSLMDLLAGRITEEQFRYQIGQRPGERNLFKHWLDSGRTIQGLVFEPGGLDQDDDYIVFTLADDPGARALRLSSNEGSET